MQPAAVQVLPSKALHRSRSAFMNGPYSHRQLHSVAGALSSRTMTLRLSACDEVITIWQSSPTGCVQLLQHAVLLPIGALA